VSKEYVTPTGTFTASPADEAYIAFARLHEEFPTLVEAITGFLHHPPLFGRLELTIRNGKPQSVHITTTTPAA
jgi:hypothetical protein